VPIHKETFRHRDSHDLVFLPIRLTEKKLIELGFEEGQTGYFHKNGVIVSCEGHVYYGEEEIHIAECNFVHHLQNLYYALTGEELILSEA
jgi:hypothetical protein